MSLILLSCKVQQKMEPRGQEFQPTFFEQCHLPDKAVLTRAVFLCCKAVSSLTAHPC